MISNERATYLPTLSPLPRGDMLNSNKTILISLSFPMSGRSCQLTLSLLTPYTSLLTPHSSRLTPYPVWLVRQPTPLGTEPFRAIGIHPAPLARARAASP